AGRYTREDRPRPCRPTSRTCRQDPRAVLFPHPPRQTAPACRTAPPSATASSQFFRGFLQGPPRCAKMLSSPVIQAPTEGRRMRAAVQRFLMFLAVATDKELARTVAYLKAENRILRSKLPKKVEVTPKERQTLLKYGKKLGSKIREVITIV